MIPRSVEARYQRSQFIFRCFCEKQYKSYCDNKLLDMGRVERVNGAKTKTKMSSLTVRKVSTSEDVEFKAIF